MRVELGVIPERLAVSIGPGIGPCCYEVPRGRFEEFRSRFGEKAVARGDGNGHRLDLRGANIALLEEVGVVDITVVSDCTACGRGLGSFRREGPAAFTRMAAFIGPFAA
jgi:copper oxidase (laccase) domain-containing protein